MIRVLCTRFNLSISVLVGFYACSTLAFSQTIPGTDIPEKTFELVLTYKETTELNRSDFEEHISRMNPHIGSYPPRFKDEGERELVYKYWSKVISEAEAYAKINPNTDAAYNIRADLYRQGHNMDVVGSAEKSIENLDACLEAFPKSPDCNLTASYLYLAIGPQYLDKAETSLSVLRGQSAPTLNQEVESGYVFLHLYRQNEQAAGAQIDKFLKAFPNSSRVNMFTQIRSGLANGIKKDKSFDELAEP